MRRRARRWRRPVAAVGSRRAAGPDDVRLAGVVLPGFANAHSHAFHRALRGRTHDEGGTFWTWRERMYALADRLDPDSYLALATGGVRRDGAGRRHRRRRVPLPAPRPGRRAVRRPERDGAALVQAAADAGVRLTLLDACYLDGRARGPRAPPARPGAAALLRRRRAALGASGSLPCGRPRRRAASAWPAIHSVRAVRAERLRRPSPAAASADRCTCTCPSSRGERGLPGLLRLQPDRAARRPRAARARHYGRARRRTSPTRTSTSLGALRHHGLRCARPPRPTSPTASARSAALHDAGPPLCVGSDQHVRHRPARRGAAARAAERLALRRARHRRRDRVAARADRRRAPLASAGRRPGDRARPPRRPRRPAPRHPAHRRCGARPGAHLRGRRRRAPTSWSTASGRARPSAPPRRRRPPARRRDRAALGLTPLRSRGLSAARRTARSPRRWSWSPSGSARGRCGRLLRTAWSRSRARSGAPGACTRRRAQRRAATGRARRCR